MQYKSPKDKASFGPSALKTHNRHRGVKSDSFQRFSRQGHGIRLIGVGGSHLTQNSYQQRNLFDWAKDLEEIQAQKEEKAKAAKEEELEQMLEQSREKFGRDMIHKGFGSQR